MNDNNSNLRVENNSNGTNLCGEYIEHDTEYLYNVLYDVSINISIS